MTPLICAECGTVWVVHYDYFSTPPECPNCNSNMVYTPQAIFQKIDQLNRLLVEVQNPSQQVREVLDLKKKHVKTWREEPDNYWVVRLFEEVGELASALVNRHEHTPELELAQISAICLNWLEKRAGDKKAQESDHG